MLLVEDHDEVRRVIERILEKGGYAVLSATTSEEALALSRTRPVDILVTDIVMPRMNGRILAETLAGRLPGLPVIFLSGLGVESIAEPGPQLNRSEFLQKPFGAAQLLAAVRRVLDG